MTVDLTTSYLGMSLAHPIVPSASPLTGSLDGLLRLQDAGASAVVLPSLFEEQIEHEAMEVHRSLEYGAGYYAEATAGYFPEMDEYNTGPRQYLDHLQDAKQHLEIPVIASLNGTSRGGWTLYARLIEEAGADALELNIYFIPSDPSRRSEEIELQYLELVGAVRGAISIPLAVKVGPYFSSMAYMARRFAEVGADGLVLFNRFYQPDIVLEDLEVRPNLVLSTSDELRLVLRWMALLHGRIDASLAATTGVHTVEDVVKLVLAGADVTMSASALLRNGPEHVTVLRDGLAKWLGDRDYASVDQAKGSLSQRSSPDPGAFERANYMRTLVTYSGSY